ncbi:DUF1275 family protein [Actinoallomurus iriomotensis]|uniref:DUF1275 domain-containing protein n=1 Tax=Actinoallomurus iriomotensis TaxID=478107 RepID=A0A9W6RLW3_9ACTN|nr:YoaK family protein [Actinoallomurus iriomotensis]GLY76412.1 hypothetical protein Airi01_046790 [Actinoallomurus iriomotensis]
MAERRTPRTGRLTAAVVLLAFGSGAVDAFSFAGLGAVFASVMTGNLVLLGVSVVHAHLDTAVAAVSAITAYVGGVLAASLWLRTHPDTTERSRTRAPRPRAGDAGPVRVRPSYRRGREPPSGVPTRRYGGRSNRAYGRGRPRASGDTYLGRTAPLPKGTGRTGRTFRTSGLATAEWPARVRAVLTVAPVAQAAVLGGWLVTGGRPGAAAQSGMLALYAFAMGAQSAGVNTLPLTGAATTYLTGTLTTLATEVVSRAYPTKPVRGEAASGRRAAGGRIGRARPDGAAATMRRRLAILAAALAGAGLDAVLLTWLRPAAPALPLAVTLTVVLVLARNR